MAPTSSTRRIAVLALAVGALASAVLAAQGRGGGGGGGMGTQERPIVAQFDADKDGRLNADERAAARQFIGTSGGGRGFGGGRGGGGRAGASPGVTISPSEVKSLAGTPLYEPTALRTFFIQFESPDWEAEMVAFNNTDVELPATVVVDGKTYRDVGVHFRGNSSFGVGNGYKRSLNVTFDWVHEDQAVEGYRTLNFLNANSDPTLLRSVLSMHIARQYIAAPKTNLARIVINGENWGVYANQQQFNKDFLEDNFKTDNGTRWKIPQGGGGGVGGFRYVGDDPASYRGTFNIKSKDDPAAWAALIRLAKTLNETPVDRLEAALAPLLDIDAYLKFLALDIVMVSGDGFYSRAADYSLYLHPNGRFHFVFHDVNEMFSTGGGGRGGFGGGGVRLDPFAAAGDTTKPIISKILAVPALRAKYVAIVREIADKSLDWRVLGPVVKQYRDLAGEEIARDTRKLYSTDEFLRGTADDGTLRTFFDQRRAFLLEWAAANGPAAR
jgi:hypothetical protein